MTYRDGVEAAAAVAEARAEEIRLEAERLTDERRAVAFAQFYEARAIAARIRALASIGTDMGQKQREQTRIHVNEGDE